MNKSLNISYLKFSRLLVLLILIGVTSCKDVFQENKPLPVAPLRYRVINTLYMDPVINYSVDKNQANSLQYLVPSSYQLIDSALHFLDITSPATSITGGKDSLIISPKISYASGENGVGRLKSTSYTALIAPAMDGSGSVKQDSLQVILLADNPAPAIEGRFQFRVINLITDGGYLSFATNTGIGSYPLPYGFYYNGIDQNTNATYYTELAGKYNFHVEINGSSNLEFEPENFPEGKTYTVVLSGTRDNSDAYPVQATFYEEGSNNVISLKRSTGLSDKRPYVRFLQTDFSIPDQVDGVYNGLDLFANINPLFTGLAFKSVSSIPNAANNRDSYKRITGGEYPLQLTPHNQFGGNYPKGTFNFTDTTYSTIYVVPPANGVPAKLVQIKDNRTIDPSYVRYRIINLAPDLGTVDIKSGSASGKILLGNVTLGTATNFINSNNDGSISDLYIVKAGTKTLLHTIHIGSEYFSQGSIITVALVGSNNATYNHPFEAVYYVDSNPSFDQSLGDGSTHTLSID